MAAGILTTPLLYILFRKWISKWALAGDRIINNRRVANILFSKCAGIFIDSSFFD